MPNEQPPGRVLVRIEVYMLQLSGVLECESRICFLPGFPFRTFSGNLLLTFHVNIDDAGSSINTVFGRCKPNG